MKRLGTKLTELFNKIEKSKGDAIKGESRAK